jgi:hypothetical protein
MNRAFYLAAVIASLGVIAILFAPAPAKDPKRRVGFLGMLLLGLGLLLFLLGLALS